mmetsp:Transcript_56860/g.133284  ORF Transcript_56860/g.133284 Transcript_56860/m.133284 type:complete len:650 (+) Transcript_56860:1816-3765(+)
MRADSLVPAALERVLGHAEVGVMANGVGLDVANHVNISATHDGAVDALRRDVLGRSGIRRLPAAPPAPLTVRQSLPVVSQGLVANGRLHRRHGHRGDLEVRAASGFGEVEPLKRAGSIVGGHVHVLGGSRGRGGVAELHVLRGKCGQDSVALRAADHSSLCSCWVSANLIVNILRREQADVGEGDRLHLAQLLEREHRWRSVDRRALRHGRSVEGAVLKTNLHWVRACRVVAKGSGHIHHVVHRRDPSDLTTLAACSPVAIVDEAHPEDTQVAVILSNEVEVVVGVRELSAHGDGSGAGVVPVVVGHLSPAHEGVCSGRRGMTRHVDSTAVPVRALDLRAGPAADHVARGGVRCHLAVSRPVRLHIGGPSGCIVVLDPAGLTHSLSARDGEREPVVPVVHAGLSSGGCQVLASRREEGSGRGCEHDRAALLGAAAQSGRHGHSAVVLDISSGSRRALGTWAVAGRGLRVDLITGSRVERADLEVRHLQIHTRGLALDALIRLIRSRVGVLDDEPLHVVYSFSDGPRDLSVGVGRQGAHRLTRRPSSDLGRSTDTVDVHGRFGGCSRMGITEVSNDVVETVGGVHIDRGHDDLVASSGSVELVQPHCLAVLAHLSDEARTAVVNPEGRCTTRHRASSVIGAGECRGRECR